MSTALPTAAAQRAAEDWEDFAARHFPAYLMGASERQAISRDAAEQFLSHFAGDAADVELVCAAAFFADPKRVRSLQSLVAHALPSLVRQLPGATRVELRRWEGGFRGRLDLPSTLALHRAGNPTQFVTRTRRRHFELPETLLVKAVVARTVELLSRLRRAKVLAAHGWGAPLLDVVARLESLLLKSALHEIPLEHIDRRHIDAARNARHPCYGLCAELQEQLCSSLDDDAGRATALARGALTPLKQEERFQVAVLIRLVQTLHEQLSRREPGEWSLELSAIQTRRDDVAALVSRHGRAVRFHYDRPVLPPGPRDRLVRHHLASTGRARPDLTLTFEREGHAPKSLVVEVKQSRKPDYLAKGLEQALVYRHEYDARLLQWPKAIVVAEGGFVGDPRPDDDVVAVNWRDLPPQSVLEVLVQAACE